MNGRTFRFLRYNYLFQYYKQYNMKDVFISYYLNGYTLRVLSIDLAVNHFE